LNENRPKKPPYPAELIDPEKFHKKKEKELLMQNKKIAVEMQNKAPTRYS